MKVKIPTSYNIISFIVYIIAVILCCCIVPNVQINTMIFYFIVLTGALFLITLSDLLKDNKISMSMFWFGLVIFGSIMAFRAQTAIDDYNYSQMFVRARNTSFFQYLIQGETEIGFNILLWILYRLTLGNYDIAQVIITYISFFAWGKAAKKYKDYCSMPIFVLLIWTHYYFLVMAGGLMRIFIAIPIVLYAMSFISEGNYKKYTLWIIIAALFHISALIMLILLVLILKEEWFYNNWGIFIMILMIVLPIAFMFIAKVLVPILGNRYAGYGIISNFSISIGSFDTIPIFIIGLFYSKYVPIERKKQFIVNMILIALSTIFSICSSFVPIGRVIYYANLGMVLLISEIFKLKPKKYYHVCIQIILIVYAFFYMMHTGILSESQVSNLFPYRHFWGIF